jgi:UPF0716 protein FxsA
MALIILSILIGIPIIEIYVFAEIGSIIGGVATVIMTLLTAILGAIMFRAQGTNILGQIQEHIRRNETLLAEIIDGFGLLLAAALLFLPGFVTDTIGFLIFIPPLRVVLIGMLFRYMAQAADARVWVIRDRSDTTSPSSSGAKTIIDAEFEDLTDENKKTEPDTTGERNNHKISPT